MSAPRVSCLMSTFGRHRLVEEAVACFMSQDYENAELLILNNHPYPLTLGNDVVNGPRRVVMHNSCGHATLGDCRNALLDMADGDLVRTWDDDDLYLPWSISQGVAGLTAAQEIRPECVAFKPTRSWCTGEADQRYKLVENAMEASITATRAFMQQCRYAAKAGDEHKPLLAEFEKRPELLHKEELDKWSGYMYRWGVGEWHISGSLGSGTVEDRTATWKDKNQDTGLGRPISAESGRLRVSPVLLDLAFFADGAPAGELHRRLIGTCPWTDVPKWRQCNEVINQFFRDATGLRVLEFGRLRGTNIEGACGRNGDGWSTKAFAENAAVAQLVTVDPNIGTIQACMDVILPTVNYKIDFRDKLGKSSAVPFDIVYVDADDCPMTNLRCLLEAKSKGYVGPRTVIAVDDVSFARKTPLIRALCDRTHVAGVIGDALVLFPRP